MTRRVATTGRKPSPGTLRASTAVTALSASTALGTRSVAASPVRVASRNGSPPTLPSVLRYGENITHSSTYIPPKRPCGKTIHSRRSFVQAKTCLINGRFKNWFQMLHCIPFPVACTDICSYQASSVSALNPFSIL